MIYKLPDLPYGYGSLKPYISEETLEFHHGKHHQAYVNNLNKLVPGTKFEGSDLDALVMNAEGAIFNNAAQVWNHTFYFSSFSPAGKRMPDGKMADAINSSFGSFEKFRELFDGAAASLFGSGWAWLVQEPGGKLTIVQESNAGNPMKKGLKPLLTCDVWEHAYYIDYRNRRPDYINAFWSVVDWDIIAGRL